MRKSDPASWLRGFFDGEGCVVMQKHHHYAVFSNTDPVLMQHARECLGGLGIGFTEFAFERGSHRRIERIHIGRERDLVRFIRRVGSTAPAKRSRMAAILRWYRRPGRPYRNKWSDSPPVDVAVIEALRASGFSTTACAEQLRMSHTTVIRVLRAAGSPFLQRRAPRISR